MAVEIALVELKSNPGLTFILSLCLNSLWCKFGQARKMVPKEYNKEIKEFYAIILNNKIETYI
jgi:hypothetical protein